MIAKVASVLLVTSGLVFVLVAYRHLWRIGRDNPLLYLGYAVLTGGFVQTVAFLAPTEGVRIDTIAVDTILVDMPLAASVYAGSIMVFVTAVLVGLRGAKQASSFRASAELFINASKLRFVALIFALVIVAALVAFANSVGVPVLDLLSSSDKRLVASDGGLGSFNAYGHLRSLAKVGMPLFLFAVAVLVYSKKRMTTGIATVLSVLALLALAPAFILSNRGAVAFAGISLAVMLLLQRRIKVTYATAFCLFAAIAFSVMSAFRFGVGLFEDPLIGLRSYLYYGGGNSIFNATMINTYVMEGNELQLGSSYLGALFFMVPRVIWPGKPLISLDEFNAYQVYSIQGLGFQAVPPGMIGELLLNFGYIGLPVGLVALGLLVAAAYRASVRQRRPFLSFLLRTIVFPRFCMKLIGSGFGAAVMETALLGLPLLAIYIVCVARDRAPACPVAL